MERIEFILQIFLSCISCYLAWVIPKKIMWEQTYLTLIADYRSCSYGVAIQGIIEFFTNDCRSNPDNILSKYQMRFHRDIPLLCCYQSNNAQQSNNTQISSDLCLHFQRRMLAQFFYQLDLCARSKYIGKQRVCRDFTRAEADLVHILILMDKAIDEDRYNEDNILWKSIACSEKIQNYKNEKGMNKYLSEIYLILRNSQKYMKV